MKYHVLLLTMMLCLAPLTPASAGPTRVTVAYLGHGQFQYKKKTYDYNDLVAAIRSDYADENIGLIIVEMGTVMSQLDKASACQLQKSLQTPVHMQLTTDDGERYIFCN